MLQQKIGKCIIDVQEFIEFNGEWILTISGIQMKNDNSISYVRFSLTHKKQDIHYFIGYLDAVAYRQFLYNFYISSKTLIPTTMYLNNILHLKCYDNDSNKGKVTDYLKYSGNLSNNYLKLHGNEVKIYYNNRMYKVCIDPAKIYLLFKGGGLDRFLIRDVSYKNMSIELYPTTFNTDQGVYEPCLTSVVVISVNRSQSYEAEVPIEQILHYLVTKAQYLNPQTVFPKETIICQFENFNLELSLNRWLLMKSVYEYLFEHLKVQRYSLYT